MAVGSLMQFHEEPRVIAWWTRHCRPVLDWLVPARRRVLLALAALYVCCDELADLLGKPRLQLHHDLLSVMLMVLLAVAISYLVFRAAASYATWPAWARRHPQLSLHGMYWGLLIALWLGAPASGRVREVFVVLALIFPLLIWRFGYVLLSGQYGRIKDSRFSDHFLTLWPVYGGSTVPYGNGFGYLSRFEAKTSEQLARSQLAGLKLLVLSAMLAIGLEFMRAFVYGPGSRLTEQVGGATLAIPRLETLLSDVGGSTPLWLAWLSIYCELIAQVLKHATHGHVVIAVLRLAGFNVFRNTYKPLLSESIVEFWNRYYFYFKELMSNFFFMPTFTRLGGRLRSFPNLRLFLAVFAAAFIGNAYFHLIKLNEVMVTGGIAEALHAQRSRFFYCFLLALGIFVSMVREQRRAGRSLSKEWPARIARIAGVWTFFSLITIWNIKGDASFTARVEFFLSLFGIGLRP